MLLGFGSVTVAVAVGATSVASFALLTLTPFARGEFELSYEPTDDPLERARRIVVRSFMGHGSSGARAHSTGFRADTYRQHHAGRRLAHAAGSPAGRSSSGCAA